MSNKRVALTNADFIEKTGEQLKFLIKSAKAYDEGDLSEAVRMAMSLRVLLNSSGKDNISLLRHLKGTNWRFIDTGFAFSASNLMTHTGLVSLQASEAQARFVPLVTSGFPTPHTSRTPYPDWWRQSVVVRDKDGNKFTRWHLVDWVANQDGGAHVDASLEASYHKLKRLDGAGWRTSIGGIDVPVAGVIDASIRQISHECIRTFERKLPTIVPTGLYSIA